MTNELINVVVWFNFYLHPKEVFNVRKLGISVYLSVWISIIQKWIVVIRAKMFVFLSQRTFSFSLFEKYRKYERNLIYGELLNGYSYSLVNELKNLALRLVLINNIFMLSFNILANHSLTKVAKWLKFA